MLTWRDDDSFEIAGIEYVCRELGDGFVSRPGRFRLLKPPLEVERYVELIRDLEPRRIVEVGTYDGASAALFAELAKPDKLVTIDIRPELNEGFTDFLGTRGLGGVVVPYCGIDQGDALRLREILADEFHGEDLDLVIDDASHLLDLTRITFNCIFPHIRPGGMYVIEDWTAAHYSTADVAPLTYLLLQLILACASPAPNAIANVSTSFFSTVVTRGDAPLDESFDISKWYGPRARALLADM